MDSRRSSGADSDHQVRLDGRASDRRDQPFLRKSGGLHMKMGALRASVRMRSVAAIAESARDTVASNAAAAGSRAGTVAGGAVSGTIQVTKCVWSSGVDCK